MSLKTLVLLLSYLTFAHSSCTLAAMETPPIDAAAPAVDAATANALREEMDAQREADETDAHIARVVRSLEMLNLQGGISMSKYEITQAQWQGVMGENPAHFSSCGERCPVENVSWNEVKEFLATLNAKTGKHYRLPTEPEWLAACRAGGNSAYCGGDDINSVAWYAQNAQDKTHGVGQKTANAWGLHDMTGNVSEWTKTCYDNDCTTRVVCGGSWINSADVAKLSTRDWLNAGLRNSRLGFRLVLDR